MKKDYTIEELICKCDESISVSGKKGEVSVWSDSRFSVTRETFKDALERHLTMKKIP